MMGQTPLKQDSLLRSFRYQAEPEKAWIELIEMFHPRIEQKLLSLRESLSSSKLPVAITEGHLSLAPHNSNPILTEWLTGVYHARAMNLYQRHGDQVKIATTADFNGTRWTTNALIHQVPDGVSYLLPAGAVARLFGKHNGEEAVEIQSSPRDLDLAASRTANRIFIHAANMSYTGAVEATLAIKGMVVTGGRVLEISPENPRQEISPLNPQVFNPVQRELPLANTARYRFPARSVSVIELECKPT
jgi:hypothetical protein